MKSLVHFPSLYSTIRFAELRFPVLILQASSQRMDSELDMGTSQSAQGLRQQQQWQHDTHGLSPCFVLCTLGLSQAVCSESLQSLRNRMDV